MSKKLFIFLILLIILAVGAWLRFSGILSNSFAFTYDVGRDMIALENIVVNHKIPLIGQTTGIEGIFYGPWWYLILSVPFFLFSGNPQGIAFFMGFIGVMTILVSFLAGKRIGGVFLGIVFSTLISISPILVSYSSQIWNPNIIPFFTVVFLLFFSTLIIDNKPIHKSLLLLFLGFLAGLIMDMEIVFGILFLLSVFISLIFVFRKRLNIREWSFFILGLLFIFSPRIIFEFRHNFLMTNKALSFFGNGFLSSQNFSITDVFTNRLGTLFDTWNYTLAGQNTIIGFILIAFIFLSLFLFYKKIDKTQKQFIKVIFIVIGIFLIGLTFFSHDIWPHYLVGMPVFYILLLSLTFNITKNVIKKLWIIFLSLLILFWINLNPIQILENIRKPVWEGNAAVYRNQIAVVDYIYGEAGGQSFKYIAYTPAVHDYNYRYLFSWYGKKKYGYSPSNKNPQVFYVILEPDHDLPFRLKDWLKIREKDGEVIEEKLVKGGIIVQTRLIKPNYK